MKKYPDLKTLQILEYPDPKLREHARRIAEINAFLQEMSERMAELMRESSGMGLAATQVGWPFRFVVLAPNPEEERVETYVNPVILSREGKTVQQEGCLSVPGVLAKVRRAQRVRVRATRADGETVEMEAEGLLARAWQHEIDHLEGGLFVDRLSPAARILVRGRLRELEAGYPRRRKPGCEGELP